MVENFDLTMVNWARAQFALTAMYHWIFVPLTLGLSWIIAFYHTIYVKTGSEEWKRLTRFWMKLFGINFAIGVATGIILEFEFGTNWSNYSWMVGDIFGAPLAIEGIFAFFLEATFFAVMFFGWDRVSRRFHLFSTWMVAVGSNMSAIWILVANAWMQYPVGQQFNPDTARFEMQNFLEVVFSPVAVTKFTHTTSSSMLLASLFIISVSSWFLLKKRHLLMARRSIVVAAVLGLLSSIFTAFTGDEAAFEVAMHQPMKLAAIEGLYQGEINAGLAAVGVINPAKKVGDDQAGFIFEIRVPFLLSLLANRELGSFVPGINDLVYGNEEHNIMGVVQKIVKGRIAVRQLDAYKNAQKDGLKGAAVSAIMLSLQANRDIASFVPEISGLVYRDEEGNLIEGVRENEEGRSVDESGQQGSVVSTLTVFNENKEYLGYGFLETPEEAVPPVAISFYSFRLMVMLGTMFPLVFIAFLFFTWKDTLMHKKWLLVPGVSMFVLGMVAQEAGWVVSEVGRQPWAIQGLLPVTVARSNLTAGTVQTTFFIFLALFTILLIAEIRIMTKQIGIGPEEN